MKTILGISCLEPRREGECPNGARVGYNGIDRIERREEMLGTYGIVWFDAYSGDRLIESFNALGVESVVYDGKVGEP